MMLHLQWRRRGNEVPAMDVVDDVPSPRGGMPMPYRASTLTPPYQLTKEQRQEALQSTRDVRTKLEQERAARAAEGHRERSK